jgi:diguanylate cyclase (GGDEF)-like protein
VPRETPGVPALDRLCILLIGPAGSEQIQVSTALGSAATLAYADTVERGLERLRRQDLDVVVVTGGRNHNDVHRLCNIIRQDSALFDLPVMLIDRPDAFPDRAAPFEWGVSDLLLQPFYPEVLRLRVQSWVRQQRLRRRLRAMPRPDLPPVADRLTGLYAHGFLHAYLDYRIAEARHLGASLAVTGLSLVGMRRINAEYGFAVGDRVLAQVGAIIARTTRAEDLPARVEGDRFCVVPNGGTLDQARTIGLRISEFLTHTPLVLGRDQALRIGVRSDAAALGPTDDAMALVERACGPAPAAMIREAS